MYSPRLKSEGCKFDFSEYQRDILEVGKCIWSGREDLPPTSLLPKPPRYRAALRPDSISLRVFRFKMALALRKAWARWLIWFFWSSVNSAKVRPRLGTPLGTFLFDEKGRLKFYLLTSSDNGLRDSTLKQALILEEDDPLIASSIYVKSNHQRTKD